MKRYIGALFLFMSIQFTYAQITDTTSILRNLKMKLYAEIDLGLLSNKECVDYLNREIKVDILKSQGFAGVTFYKISNQVLTEDSNGKVRRQYFIPSYCGDFIYGYNNITQHFYRLKGTIGNDFKELYNEMDIKWTDWKPITKLNKGIINGYIKEYWIEGIDLECLFQSLMGKQGTCLDYYTPPVAH